MIFLTAPAASLRNHSAALPAAVATAPSAVTYAAAVITALQHISKSAKSSSLPPLRSSPVNNPDCICSLHCEFCCATYSCHHRSPRSILCSCRHHAHHQIESAEIIAAPSAAPLKSLCHTTCSSTKCNLLHHLQLSPLHHLQCSVLLLPLPHAAAHIKIAENIAAPSAAPLKSLCTPPAAPLNVLCCTTCSCHHCTTCSALCCCCHCHTQLHISNPLKISLLSPAAPQ